MKIHITKQGESIEGIANTYAVSRQDLTGINPHINLSSELVPGLKLKIPETIRTEKDKHIEQFFPNLTHEHPLKEQAVPIGLKPFDGAHGPVHHTNHHPESMHHTPEHTPPWAHLNDPTTHLNPEAMHHHTWNHPFPPFTPYDTRAIIPPVPYFPPYPYPYPPYGYPSYGYGLPLPVPVPGFGPGFGHGWHGGGHFGGHGHGGGHHR